MTNEALRAVIEPDLSGRITGWALMSRLTWRERFRALMRGRFREAWRGGRVDYFRNMAREVDFLREGASRQSVTIRCEFNNGVNIPNRTPATSVKVER